MSIIFMGPSSTTPEWVTFEGRRIKCRTQEKGEHYDLIVEVTKAKIRQNPQARHVLLSTGDLILRPDHHQSPDAPPAWRYHQILMMIRTDLLRSVGIE